MLELVHIAKNYDSPTDTGSVSVLKDISLKLDSGRSLVIVGPSGSGKSTMINKPGVLLADEPTGSLEWTTSKKMFLGRLR